MTLLHLALVNASEANSDRFYRDLLGCEKQPPRKVPAGLMKQLFNLDEEATIINYIDKDGLIFEVFIVNINEQTPISHACLAIEDRAGFLQTCESMSIAIRHVVKADGGSIVFIADYDNNLFEIKEKISQMQGGRSCRMRIQSKKEKIIIRTFPRNAKAFFSRGATLWTGA